MSNPIHVMWRLNLRPNAYEMSEEALKAIRKKSAESLASVGGETVLKLDTQWSNEKWQKAGVIKYPSMQALQTHTKNLEKVEWFRFHEAETLLGVVLFDEDIEMPNPIYVMWRLNVRPTLYDLSEEKVQQMQKVRDESLARVGAKKVLQLDTRWSNEKWQFAGVMKYPSLGALQTFTKSLKDVGWFRAVETETLPGIEQKEE